MLAKIKKWYEKQLKEAIDSIIKLNKDKGIENLYYDPKLGWVKRPLNSIRDEPPFPAKRINKTLFALFIILAITIICLQLVYPYYLNLQKQIFYAKCVSLLNDKYYCYKIAFRH